MNKSGNSFFKGKQAIIKSHDGLCRNASDLTESHAFRMVLSRFLGSLKKRNSSLLEIFPSEIPDNGKEEAVIELLQRLTSEESEEIIAEAHHLKDFFRDTYRLSRFVENFYNYWRSFERFFIYYTNDQENKTGYGPYMTFHETIESLNHLVRKVYRDIAFNITHQSLRVYRQLPAGCQVGLIASKKKWPCPESYAYLKEIPFIRRILLEPPLIIDPPMNKRSGRFKKVEVNPLEGITIDPSEWLCYPAKVGDLTIHLFFNNRFINLGTSLVNLFDFAEEEEIRKKPDAIYLYGIPGKALERYGENRTVFYEDNENEMMIGAIPDNDDFGYFGYAKKMMLTLHNIIMMKRGRMPVHGAMARIIMKDGKASNVVILGDSGTGKSETLEAFRRLSEEYLREITIIFDDMGSLEIRDGQILAYGTETGAFVRLDDLNPDFAFGNIDRSIIMSPQKTNARAVLPITTLNEILHGYPIDYMLYANNYEEVDNNHPYIERFSSAEEAIPLFREGTRMAKGTTMEKGLVHSYFANVFGPTQYKALHEPIAKRFFETMFETDITVAQLRTRLGIPGFEKKGPECAAKALFEAIQKS